MNLAYLAEIVLAVQVVGITIGMGMRRDLAEHWLLLVTWPVVLPALVAVILCERAGLWVRWRGPLSEVGRHNAGLRDDDWDERCWGPFFRGHWIRRGYAGFWVGVGLRGGRGVLVGRTVGR